MSFRNKLQYFLVKKLQISNKEAQSMLFEGKVFVNNRVTSANIHIEPEYEIRIESKIIQAAKTFKYLAFYKPRGVETTLNPNIENNLVSILPDVDIFPVGRLDKESEGLLILTDDGRIYDKILRNENKIEKEYIVCLNKFFDDIFLKTMANGVTIMGKTTLPCKIEAITNTSFRIVLTQGLNRQIRRMCYKLGYEVSSLCRIRIGDLKIGDLSSGNWRKIELKDILDN